MATLLITHDLGLAAEHCDRIVVMHAGHVVESAPTAELFAGAAPPYTARSSRRRRGPGVKLDDLAAIPGGLPDLRGRSAALPLPRALRAHEAACDDGRCRSPTWAPRTPGRVPAPAVRRAARRARASAGASPSQRGPRGHHAWLHAVDDVTFDIRPRRVRGAGRRVRLRQVDPGAAHHAAARSDRGADLVRRPRYRRGAGGAVRRPPRARADPDGLPGSHRQPQPALHRVSHDRRSAAAARQAGRPRRARRAGPRRSPISSACRGSCSAASRISSRAGRSSAWASRAPSRSSRSCSCSTSPPRRSTCSVQARHPEAARRPAPAPRHELSLRLPRPEHRAPPGRSRARDVPRQDRGVGPGRRRVRAPAASVHAGAPVRGARRAARRGRGRASGCPGSRGARSIPRRRCAASTGAAPRASTGAAREMPVLRVCARRARGGLSPLAGPSEAGSAPGSARQGGDAASELEQPTAIAAYVDRAAAIVGLPDRRRASAGA